MLELPPDGPSQGPAQREPDASDAFETLVRLLTDRHSCRAFLPDPLARETIERIVTAAGRAPSWCNTQPWQLTITEGQGAERFRRLMLEQADRGKTRPDFPFPGAYTGENARRRRECGFQLYDALGIARGDHEARVSQSRRNFAFFGAPHVAVLTTSRELGVYGAVDCGAFVAAFLLAAAAVGVAAIPQAAPAVYPDAIRDHFGLPDDRLVVCTISFGWADDEHPANRFRTSRAAIGDIVTWHPQ